MKSTSKPVTSDSLAKPEDIMKIARRFSTDTYKRPIEEEEKLLSIILDFTAGRPMVLDAACGIGESTYHLAKRYPDHAVLGVDKSLSRIERNNSFKREMPSNGLLIKADMQSVWPLLHKMKTNGEIEITKQYILYPNPWPKLKALKKRWYANPMLAYILDLSSRIELRSNWKVYLEDFKIVFEELEGGHASLEEFDPGEGMTPFERKYHLSGQKLFKLELEKPRIG